MKIRHDTPWHKTSYDRFLQQTLPQLLGERVPLMAYDASPTDEHACRIHLAVRGGPPGQETIELTFDRLPYPDKDGVFHMAGKEIVVCPIASRRDLGQAEIRCVGEQLHDALAERIGQAPAGLKWDEPLVRSWLQLDGWFAEFFNGRIAPRLPIDIGKNTPERSSVDVLDSWNWLSRRTHLRRLLIAEPRHSADDCLPVGGRGRVCPFETPEGPNIGRVLTIAVGAEIRDGRLVVADDCAQAGLGLTASMVPLLEHDDANRLLMGVNMMRQCLTPPDPEPALVQAGTEPDDANFWCGRNLLTAFVSWGDATFGDGIVLSESAAARLGYPDPIEPGDKMANRHGTKGVVARILPDAEMPHLPDGTPVELCFNFIGCHARLNFGQIREAVLGRIAKVQGKPVISPPFAGPSPEELAKRLAEAGLPADGMETLLAGKDGPKLARPSTVGYVYWGKLYHLAAGKLIFAGGEFAGQEVGELEFSLLRDIGAHATVRELFCTGAARKVEPRAEPPSPAFVELARRLSLVGVHGRLEDGRVMFHLGPPTGRVLKFARPVAHPWLSGEELAQIGGDPQDAAFAAVADANERLQRVLGSGPETLAAAAADRMAHAVRDYCESLLPSDTGVVQSPFGRGPLAPNERVRLSGRAVIAPAGELDIDHLGVPEEMAWALFGPLVQRELGDAGGRLVRDSKALGNLDEILAKSWVLLYRAPAVIPTAILAFRPVRVPEKVIRLPLAACWMMNADFDGDQAAVFLPLGVEAQREAGELLSIRGRARRDPAVLDMLMPVQDALWALADLARTPAGMNQLCQLVGPLKLATGEVLTRKQLTRAVRGIHESAGPDRAIEVVRVLWRRGLELAKASGASLSPFAGRDLVRPVAPQSNEPWVWNAYRESLIEQLNAVDDFDSPDLGPQLLAVKSGARGNLSQLATLVGVGGAIISDVSRRLTPARGNFVTGLSPEEAFTRTVGARIGLAQAPLNAAFDEMVRTAYGVRPPGAPGGRGVLARAWQSRHPGVVFASAAARGEMDPLTDIDTRLFVGLPAS